MGNSAWVYSIGIVILASLICTGIKFVTVFRNIHLTKSKRRIGVTADTG